MDTGMAAVPDDKVEALARALVHQAILAAGWYPSLPDEEKQEFIGGSQPRPCRRTASSIGRRWAR
jgi:hypothetical protein